MKGVHLYVIAVQLEERPLSSFNLKQLDKLIVISKHAVELIDYIDDEQSTSILSKDHGIRNPEDTKIKDVCRPCLPPTKYPVRVNNNTFSSFMSLLENYTFRNTYLNTIHTNRNIKYESANIYKIDIYIKKPAKISIGYKSQELALRRLEERIELEDAMHWLSTLGGAYSNLGEHSLAFAHQACDNAFRQMKIAVRSQDPFNIDRCWLYVAMSLMQQGELKKSRKIIEHIYRKTPKNQLIERRTEDEKLEKMCLGIWARLKHVWDNNKSQ